nr:5809_t:CDS:2 [Entrophospora candida]
MSKTFSLICNNNTNPVCACDFRLNIYGCPEEYILVKSNQILIGYCFLLISCSIANLYYLIVKKDYSFLLQNQKYSGYLRLRPQHTYHGIALAYFSFGFISSRALSASLSILYPISIVYSTSAFKVGTNFGNNTRSSSTLSQRHQQEYQKSTTSSSSYNKLLIDLVCLFMMIIPIVAFISLAGITGHYADKMNLDMANKVFTIHNLIWIVWIIIYVVIMLIVWVRFIRIVWENMNELMEGNRNRSTELQSKLVQLRKSSINLSLPVLGQVVVAIIYLPAHLMYGLFQRTDTIFNHNINLLYFFIWNFLIPVVAHIIQWIMTYNVLTMPSSSTKKTFNDDNSTSHHSTSSSSFTINNNDETNNINNDFSFFNKDKKVETISMVELTRNNVEEGSISISLDYNKSILSKLPSCSSLKSNINNGRYSKRHRNNNSFDIIDNVSNLSSSCPLPHSKFNKRLSWNSKFHYSSNRHSKNNDDLINEHQDVPLSPTPTMINQRLPSMPTSPIRNINYRYSTQTNLSDSTTLPNTPTTPKMPKSFYKTRTSTIEFGVEESWLTEKPSFYNDQE